MFWGKHAVACVMRGRVSAEARARTSLRGRVLSSERPVCSGDNARARVGDARARTVSEFSSSSPGRIARARVSCARPRVSLRDSSGADARARNWARGRVFGSEVSSSSKSSFSAKGLPPKCFPLLKVTALTFSLGFTTV